MDAGTNEQKETESRFGQLSVEPDDLPPLVGPGGQPVVGIKYVWRGSSALAGQLSQGFSFAMRCILCQDGVRRFYPTSFEGLIAKAFEGGLAILNLTNSLDPQQRYSYRAMYLLLQRVRATREHFENRLLNAGSLHISRVGRDLAEERTILPPTLGLNAQGQGKPWSVERLLREGRDAAVVAGIPRPTEEECVHHGLVAAARLNPLYLRAEEIPPIVRQALYESITGEGPLDPELVDMVVERTLAAMNKHLVEPAGEFDDWFSGPKNSFVQQIAKRKLLPGGVLDRDQVRRALQDLGWRAYRYVGDCIHAMMRVFLGMLSQDFTLTERRWFEQMHCRQQHFGDLPLVLLVERFPFLKSIVWEVWEKPDDKELIAVLHRLLAFYGEIASARRQVDRTVKQRRGSHMGDGERSPLTVGLPTASAQNSDAGGSDGNATDDRGSDGNATDDDDDRGSDGDTVEDIAEVVEEDEPDLATETVARFDALAALIRENQGVRCNCSPAIWVDEVKYQDELTLIMSHKCGSCGFNRESKIGLKRLKALATANLRQ